MKRLITASIILLLLFSVSFSATCTMEETYCAEFRTESYNCRTDYYSYDCTLYGVIGTHEECDTCTSTSCDTCTGLTNCVSSSWTSCDTCTSTSCDTCSSTICGTKVVCDTCRQDYTYSCRVFDFWSWSYVWTTCTGTRMVDCNCRTVIDIHNCWTDYYNCNCRTDSYDCNCVDHYETSCDSYTYDCNCKDSTYDCNCKTFDDYGYYNSTCYGSNQVCDTRNTSDCVNYDTRLTSYYCEDLRIDSVNVNGNFLVDEEILLSYSLSECHGDVLYEINTCSESFNGIANCGSNTLTFTPTNTGFCSVSGSFTDNVSSLDLTMASFNVEETLESVSFNNGEKAFLPANGDFTSGMEQGFYDDLINDLISDGLSNRSIFNYFSASFAGVFAILTLSQRRRIYTYLESKREAFFANYVNTTDRSSSNNLVSFGQVIGLAGLGVMAVGAATAGILALAGAVAAAPFLTAGLAIGGLIGTIGGCISLFGYGAGMQESNNSLDREAYWRKNKWDIILETFGLLFDFATMASTITDLTRAINKIGSPWRIIKVVTDTGEEITQQTDEILQTFMKNTDEGGYIATKVVRFAELPENFLSQLKRTGLYDKVDDFIFEHVDDADFAVELLENGNWVLKIDDSADLSKISDYDLLHEKFEIITDSLHPLDFEVMEKINNMQLLKDLDLNVKTEIIDWIQDRLIADRALIREYPQYAQEILDGEKIIDKCNEYLLGNDFDNIVDSLSKVAYYEEVTGESIVGQLFNIDEYYNYYLMLKQLMGGI